MTAQTTLPRRQLSRLLRELRERTYPKLSRYEAAKGLEVSPQTLWRYESGQNAEAKRMFINAACTYYGATDEERAVLLHLAEEAKKPGWWHSYDSIPPDFDLYLGLEQHASKIVSFQLIRLPGLAQTPNYRRALSRAFDSHAPQVEVAKRLEVLAKRQERLTSIAAPLELCMVIGESALRQCVGGPEVMAEQLRHLASLATLPNVGLRVVTQESGSHIGLLTDSFVLLEFPRATNPRLTEPPMVYIECFTGDLYLEKSTELERYRDAYARIEEAALDPARSQALIQTIAEEFES